MHSLRFSKIEKVVTSPTENIYHVSRNCELVNVSIIPNPFDHNAVFHEIKDVIHQKESIKNLEFCEHVYFILKFCMFF